MPEKVPYNKQQSVSSCTITVHHAQLPLSHSVLAYTEDVMILCLLYWVTATYCSKHYPPLSEKRGNEMGGACGAFGGGERCAQGSGGET